MTENETAGRTTRSGQSIRNTLSRMLDGYTAGVPEEEARKLEARIDEHLGKVRSALSDNEFLDVALAERIATACRALLMRYSSLDPNGRASVIGAVRYFVEPQDAENDFSSVVGFEDDAEVVNFVIALTRSDIPLIKLEG